MQDREEEIRHALRNFGLQHLQELDRLGITDHFIQWAIHNSDPLMITDVGIAKRAHGFIAGYKLAVTQ